MLRKICPIGNSQGISIPKDILEKLHLEIGSAVEVELDEKNRKIVIEAKAGRPEDTALDREFASPRCNWLTWWAALFPGGSRGCAVSRAGLFPEQTGQRRCHPGRSRANRKSRSRFILVHYPRPPSAGTIDISYARMNHTNV